MSVAELQEYGLVEMDDGEIRDFLSSQQMGVLGLPGDEVPYLIPILYGYDGDERLYFTYLIGSSSRKKTLSDETDTASFLVFTVDTMYNWQSALLTGTLSEVPESDWDALEETLSDAWRPSLIETATLSGDVAVFELSIEERTGIKHQGLPPALRPDTE